MTPHQHQAVRQAREALSALVEEVAINAAAGNPASVFWRSMRGAREALAALSALSPVLEEGEATKEPNDQSDLAAMQRMRKAREFPANTCPASRHVAIMAERLIEGGDYPMFREEPGHCAGSLASVVASLWEARVMAEDARDAARYRWLRDHSNLIASNFGSGVGLRMGGKDAEDRKKLDSHIDAAMAAQSKEQQQ